MAQALNMGDEVHNRNAAASGLLLKNLLPALNFTGTPAGIDARRVVDTSILPVIDTGIAHRRAGIGQIGAGVTTAPLGCFTQAIRALGRA